MELFLYIWTNWFLLNLFIFIRSLSYFFSNLDLWRVCDVLVFPMVEFADFIVSRAKSFADTSTSYLRISWRSLTKALLSHCLRIHADWRRSLTVTKCSLISGDSSFLKFHTKRDIAYFAGRVSRLQSLMSANTGKWLSLPVIVLGRTIHLYLSLIMDCDTHMTSIIDFLDSFPIIWNV